MSSRFTRKLVPTALVVAIASLLAASISQTVESAHVRPRDVSTTSKTPKSKIAIVQAEQAVKTRRFPNMDVRVSEPDTMAKVAGANASSITQGLQTRKTAVEQAL